MRWMALILGIALILMTLPGTALAAPASTGTAQERLVQENLPADSDRPSSSQLLGRYLGNDPNTQAFNMTPFDDREVGRGAECPRGSGRYCSNYLPYCCRSRTGGVYCARNRSACSR